MLASMLDTSALAPHGVCLLWRPELLWLHILSDAATGLAYWSIPVALVVLVRRRRDIAFPWVFELFGLFILLCGATHFTSIWVLWFPDYEIEGVLKALTAVVSVATAVVVWPLLPRILALPSPAELATANAALLQEVQERREAEARLHTTQLDLVETARRATIGTVCAGVAHEMSQPVNVISLWTERARSLGEAPPRIERALNVVLEQTRRLGQLLDRIRLLSRQANGEGSIFDAVAATTAVLEATTLPPDAELSLHLPQQALPVRGSLQQFTEAVSHLLVNASDAMATSTKRAPRLAVDISDGPEPGTLAIELRDSGGGVPGALGQSIFEPFVTTKPPQQGSGLGLAIAAGIAHNMGGRLDYRNLEDESGPVGAAFRLILPLASPLVTPSP
jgi:signal transduction histidine kinase